MLASLLSACTTMTATTNTSTTSTPKLSWEERSAILSHLQSWHVTGKIAVKTAQDAGSASLDWMQNNQIYNVSLSGPLGAGSLQLHGQPGAVTLDTSEGKHYSADNAEDLLARGWGFHMPISDIRYWIRGLPVPGVPADKQFDADGRLSTLAQQGWHIQFLDYTKVGNIDLPNKLAISSATLKSKIIIYQWNLAH